MYESKEVHPVIPAAPVIRPPRRNSAFRPVVKTNAMLLSEYKSLAAQCTQAAKEKRDADVKRLMAEKKAAFAAWWNATRYERHPNKKR